MMDGLALGESTPGPLIMVVTFVGFVGGYTKAVLGVDDVLLGGIAAACLVTWFTFLPLRTTGRNRMVPRRYAR